jgi:hypothetical protein
MLLINISLSLPYSRQLVAVGDVQGKVVVWQQPSYKEDK